MSISKTMLTGGNFQDSEGNVLANGYLKMVLSSDESVNDSQICSGISLNITLDGNGSAAAYPTIPADQYVWANDVMSPTNSYYTVTGYTAAGQPAWGPNNQQVTSGGVGGGTFDIGTWVPNQVISWSPSVQSLDLEINNSPASSQNLQNLVNSGTVTVVDNGGGNISFAAAAGGVGDNVADVPWSGSTRQAYGYPALSISGYTYCQMFFAGAIRCSAQKWTVSVNVSIVFSAPLIEMCLIRTLKDSLTTVDVTPITFGGSATPAMNATGNYTSDVISLPIDAQHDYYFCFTGPAYGGTGAIETSSSFGVSTNVAFGNTNNGGSKCSTTWASAVGGGSGFNTAFPLGIANNYFISGWNAA